MTFAQVIRFQSCVLIALLTVVIAGCGGARARYGSHFERGKQYLAQGNLDKAGIEFRNALQIEPRDADALYFTGRVAEARRNWGEAAGLYEAAIDAQPAFDEARARLGKMLVFGGASKRALDVVAPALLRSPDNPDLLALRAAARHQLKDNAAAEADAEHAVRVSPANENAVAVLAALYTDRHDYSGAISVVEKAVSLQPKSLDLREVLTNLYLLTSQGDKAEEQMRKIIELKPEELALRAQLAAHLRREHKLDAAQVVLEEAVRSFAKLADTSKVDKARLMLVDFMATERSRAQGEKMLREFIAQEPDNYALRFGLGELLQRAGANQEAISVYKDVIARDKWGAHGLAARDRIAAMQLAGGDKEQARKLVAEVLGKSPRDDDALLLRADIELQERDSAGAIGDLRAVLRDQPRSAVVQRALARAYLEKGQPGLAEDALRAALDMAPDDAGTRAELAQQLVRGKHTDQAVILLEEGVRRTPQSLPLRVALTTTYLVKQDSAAARAAADDLKTLQPQSPVGFYFAGMAALQQNHLDDSQNELEHALALKPGDVDTLQALVRVDAAARKPERSLPRFQAAVEHDPTNARLVMDAAAVFEKQGHVDEAIAAYRALYKGNPAARQVAANNLAMLLVTYKTDQASLDQARDLTNDFASSDNSSLLDTQGWVHFKRGEFRDALPVLERASAKAPDSTLIRDHLAMAELKLGVPPRVPH